MSSNIRVKRVCQHCGNLFVAQTTVTKFCSDSCAKKNYKKRKRKALIDKSNQVTRDQVIGQIEGASIQHETITPMVKLFIDIEELSAVTSLSRRTLFRLMEDKEFPRIKIGRRLLFKKDEVLNYLTSKFQVK